MSKQPRIRVLVVDDHPLMREALTAAIDDEPDMQVVGEAADGNAAVAQVQELQPDVTVMDLFMPTCGGVQAMMQIHHTQPDAHVLALTSSQDDAMLAAALEAGALGYLVKDSPRTEILHAIRQVSRGNAFFPAHVANKLAHLSRANKNTAQADVELLTDRERDVLQLIGQGASNKQIAEQLQLSESTVRTHVQHILDKLHLENRNQAILYGAHSPNSWNTTP
ncbi:MAG: response regulator transcription factor [Chloroflexi bacterium]|nr:response regulator transcription factor [Chloroflexota bacterium]